jgi:alcohol dehydrogenase class IV
MSADFPKEVLFPQKVLFHDGALAELPREAAEFGCEGLVVHGTSFKKSKAAAPLIKALKKAGLRVEFYARSGGEPALPEITKVIATARKIKSRWVAGIGGGSVIDLAKAAAGLFHAKNAPVYYQEGGALEKSGIPLIAVPTTAGAGSEATPNAVITHPAKKNKLSIRDKSFLAKKIILDPGLLGDLPSRVICYSGMDALVQAYESFISKNATWFSEAFALKAVRLIHHHLLSAVESRSRESLSAMLLASFFAGTALAASRLGVIHGIAHPLGALYGEPHGLVCSACFLPSLKLNRDAMGKKYDCLSQAVGTDFFKRVEGLMSALDIRSPFKGKEILEKEMILRETLASGSTAANPKPVTREDVEFFLRDLF